MRTVTNVLFTCAAAVLLTAELASATCPAFSPPGSACCFFANGPAGRYETAGNGSWRILNGTKKLAGGTGTKSGTFRCPVGKFLCVYADTPAIAIFATCTP